MSLAQRKTRRQQSGSIKIDNWKSTGQLTPTWDSEKKSTFRQGTKAVTLKRTMGCLLPVTLPY